MKNNKKRRRASASLLIQENADPVVRVVVKGDVIGAIDAELPGAYLGSVATAVLAVPEPSTYTLMFAGLTGLGVVLRGRRRS